MNYWVNQNFRELTVQMFSAPPFPPYSHRFCTQAEQVWMQMVDDAGIFSTLVRVEVWKQRDRPCQGSKEIFARGNDFVWRSQHLGISSARTEASQHSVSFQKAVIELGLSHRKWISSQLLCGGFTLMASWVPPHCSLTTPPQKNEEKKKVQLKKSSLVEIRIGRRLAHCC